MKRSEAYMLGWTHALQGKERDETGLSEDNFAPYYDGFETGGYDLQRATRHAGFFDTLTEVNEKAFKLWNLGGDHTLPTPPSGSGCRIKYCWMPVDTKHDNHLCTAHGGKDAPIPKVKR